MGELTRAMNAAAGGDVVKNLLFHCRGGLTYIWVTLRPERAEINAESVSLVQTLLAECQSHSDLFWRSANEESSPLELSKLDCTMDMQGSF